ncbi:MAG: DUF502 domain-containing protein [Candidatus Binatia bacterium]|nr:DUF502 domain-containing protein [Candidatus Binatia bacterium]
MSTTAKPHFLRRTCLTGLLILFPLVVTYFLIAFLFNLFANAGAPLVPALSRLLGPTYSPWIEALGPVVNLLLSLTVVFLLGLVGTNILGRRLITAFETLLLRVPLVKTIYGAAKQMVETFHGSDRAFRRVVLVQYPRPGLWVIGFVAAERRDTLHLAPSDTLLAVFIPTTPNPTSGFLVLVPPEDVVDVDYSVEEAFTFIVSSGIVGKDLAPPPQARATAHTSR